MQLSFLSPPLHSHKNNKFAKNNQWELGGTISFTSTTPVMSGITGESYSIFKLAPSAGYFVADCIELGVMVDLTSYKYSGSTSYTDYTLYFTPSYNFRTNSIAYPYVQGQIGYTGLSVSSDANRSGLAWGIEGGVKINVVGNGLVKAGINYNQRTLTPSGATSRYGYNTVSVVLGLGLFL